MYIAQPLGLYNHADSKYVAHDFSLLVTSDELVRPVQQDLK